MGEGKAISAPQAESANPEARPRRASLWGERVGVLAGDAVGGFAAALIAIPYAMTLGAIAFAALGPEYASVGVGAALLASVIANAVAALVPASRAQIMGPRASITVVFASMLAVLAVHPLLQTAQGPDTARILTIACTAMFLAGVLQIGFAYIGFGRAIKFVPYPVVAGFMNGIALLLVISQAGPALGIENGRPLADALLGALRPGAVAVTLSVLAGIAIAPRFARPVPPLVFGLLVGIAVHHLASAFMPGSTGAVIGALAGTDLLPREFSAMLALAWRGEILAWTGFIVANALLLAAVASLDGLLASVAADTVTRGQHDTRRILVGQGLGCMLAAGFSSMPVAANAHTRIGNYAAGGRTRMSTLFHAGFMLLALISLTPLLARVPVAALAGCILYIAWTLLDRWSRDLLRRLREHRTFRADIAINLAIVLGVALALVLTNMLIAFTVGVVATVGLLLVRLSGSPVRRVLDGTVRMSLKVRPAEARALLQPLARQIRILELEGELFFGTADRLKSEVERMSDGIRYVILDLRRVHEIDASGARMLDVLAQAASQRGTEVLLSHLRADEPRGQYLRAVGAGTGLDAQRWFPDLDRALEWAEDRLLERARFENSPELAPGELALFAGLEEAEKALLLASIERHELRHGEVVFLEGEPGDRLYLIARGAVSIKLKLDDETRARRLATFTAGVHFGEMAIIDGSARSADAFAKGDHVVLYTLSAARFAELVQRSPATALKIYRNLSRELAARLRTTSAALRALE